MKQYLFVTSEASSTEYLSDAFVLLNFECHKLQRDLDTEESQLKPLSLRESRAGAIICSLRA